MENRRPEVGPPNEMQVIRRIRFPLENPIDRLVEHGYGTWRLPFSFVLCYLKDANLPVTPEMRSGCPLRDDATKAAMNYPCIQLPSPEKSQQGIQKRARPPEPHTVQFFPRKSSASSLT